MLNKKIEKLVTSHEQQTHLQRNQVVNKDSEIRRLLEEISKQMEAYQNLLSTKTALDMEIAVYRKLVECEEDRLGIEGPDDSFDLGSTSEPGSPDLISRFKEVNTSMVKEVKKSSSMHTAAMRDLAGHTHL